MTRVRERAVVRSRTVIKAVPDLTDDEYEACLGLTFTGMAKQPADRLGPLRFDINGDPNYGSMYGKTKLCRSGLIPGHAVMLKDVGGTIVGWALVFEEYHGLHIYIYVHPDARRMKIGEKLYRSARRRFGALRTHPWDTKSREFYRSQLSSS